MYYTKIEERENSTVIEDIVKPQIKCSVGMFDYWFWKSGRNSNHYVLELRYSDDFERINNLLNKLRGIEKAEVISYEEYKTEVCQMDTILEEPVL